MDRIFGRTFRRQELVLPRWLRGLQFLLIAAALIYFAFIFWHAGRLLRMGYERFPECNRVLAGELLAFIVGAMWLAAACGKWRNRLYLAPAMRDLVLTPGTPWQILRVATRWCWLSRELYYIAALALLLHPWVFEELWQSAKTLEWLGLLLWLQSISAVVSVLLALVLQVLVDTVALALVLLMAAFGLGGASWRWPAFEYAGKWCKGCTQFGLLALGVSGLVVLAVPLPSPLLAGSVFYRAGEAFVSCVADGASTGGLLLSWFPVVAWFDAFRCVAVDGDDQFARGLLRCALWLGVAAAVGALSLRRALSLSARATWHGEANAPRPADAADQARRPFDPDKVNGPLEALLLGWIGRMGRAVMRLLTSNFAAGAIDRHLWHSLKLVPLCIAGGWASMLLVPELAVAICRLFDVSLYDSELSILRNCSAVVWVACLAQARMRNWGWFTGLSDGSFRMTAAEQDEHLGLPGLRRYARRVRGDNRYPLYEIYAVGFNDAILLPTLHVAIAAASIGALALIEGAALDLWSPTLLWVVAIAVPAQVQLAFLLLLGQMPLGVVHYSRHWLWGVARMLVGLYSAIGLLFAVGLLITYLCSECLRMDCPWTGWLGSLNILVVFDITLYGAARWWYVRRRFDAERHSRDQLV